VHRDRRQRAQQSRDIGGFTPQTTLVVVDQIREGRENPQERHCSPPGPGALEQREQRQADRDRTESREEGRGVGPPTGAVAMADEAEIETQILAVARQQVDLLNLSTFCHRHESVTALMTSRGHDHESEADGESGEESSHF
jgi:hypothetical protein